MATKKKTRTQRATEINGQRLLIASAVDSIVAKYGPPAEITTSQLIEAGELEFCYLSTIFSSDDRDTLYSDFQAILADELLKAFYGQRANAVLKKSDGGPSLSLTKAQTVLLEKLINEKIVEKTVNSIVAPKYLLGGLDREELYQIGRIALCRAVQSVCDDERKLRSFCISCIRRAAMTEIKRYADKLSDHALRIDQQATDSNGDDIGGVREIPSTYGNPEETYMDEKNVYEELLRYANEYTGVLHLGILAMAEMYRTGENSTTVARKMNIPPNRLGAYLTKARDELRHNADFMTEFGLSF